MTVATTTTAETLRLSRSPIPADPRDGSDKLDRVGYRPVRTKRTANGVVLRKFQVAIPVRKNTTQA